MKLNITTERWPLKKPFSISSGTMRHIDTVLVELTEGGHRGRGEAAGVDYLGEDADRMVRDIEAVRAQVEAGIDRAALHELLGPGGARNALDCALWDLEAKASGRSVWDRVCPSPRPVSTAYTVGLASTSDMAMDAEAHRDFEVLKLKAGRGDPVVQVQAVHAAAPHARIIMDVNQGWTLEELAHHAPRLARLGVGMIEQPLPAGQDEALREYTSPVPLCADESCQDSGDLERMPGLYQMVNIKLDKAGGLTEALKMVQQAKRLGLELMVGNMLGSSLAMAPAFVIAQSCRYVDLDGPLLQAEDRDFPMQYERGRVTMPVPELWG